MTDKPADYCDGCFMPHEYCTCETDEPCDQCMMHPDECECADYCDGCELPHDVCACDDGDDE